MPHQCLKCGRIFEEGSSELLRGCPSCGGSKFVYIGESPSNGQREIGKREKFVKEFVENSHHEKGIDIGIDEERRKELLQRFLRREKIPETIEIKEPGEYEIDLKGLLDEEPIIIKKDNSYIIHLPSLFEILKRPKK